MSGKGDDIRYTGGNKPRSRRDLVDHGHGLNGPKILDDIHDDVSSATYRTNAADEGGVLLGFLFAEIAAGFDQARHRDLRRQRPCRHRLRDRGRRPHRLHGCASRFLRHPQRLWRAIWPKSGAIRRRVQKLAADAAYGYANRDDDGHLIGGHLVLAANEALPDFSLEQYTGNVEGASGDGENARFRYNTVELGFFEYVRASVSGGTFAYNPVFELRSTIRTLCNDLKDRALYVNMAVKEGHGQTRRAPTHMPDNIYNADDDEWETYSTPSRDARLKTAFAQFYIDLQKMIFFWEQRDPRIVYDGISLKDDLNKMYAEETAACSISYTNGAGVEVTLGFDDIAARLFALDFDPHHCIERRWGASGRGASILR